MVGYVENSNHVQFLNLCLWRLLAAFISILSSMLFLLIHGHLYHQDIIKDVYYHQRKDINDTDRIELIQLNEEEYKCGVLHTRSLEPK